MQENEEMKQRKKKHLVLTSYPHKHKRSEHRISRLQTNIATQMLKYNASISQLVSGMVSPLVSFALYQSSKYHYWPGFKME